MRSIRITLDIVYIASASGGIWKTVDGGLVWTPLTDELSNLNHGCVAIDPSDTDTIYAGTGEYTTLSGGDGLFRSTDGGTSWQRIGTVAQVGSTCSRVTVDPIDSQVIHVTGGSGYARTDDGGATWNTFLTGPASDLALNPANPQIVYVGRHNDGVYRSTNGGDSFAKLAGGLPQSDINRIILAIAASNPSVVYAAMLDGSHLDGLYRTADGGDTWSNLPNTPDFPYPQGWYDACLTVDPTNPDVVYAGGVFPSYAVAGVIKSTDGGATWDDITVGATAQLHPDQHALTVAAAGTLWVGNDGGVWKKPAGSNDWINTNDTLTLTQNYNIALHPTDTALIIGGTQDNGTAERQSDIEDWPQILSGDGGFCAYDFDEPERRYVSYVYLNIYRINPGGTIDYISGPWDDPVNFIAPLVMDPNDSDTLLGGTDRVWRTTNASTDADWNAISTSVVGAGGTLNAIAVAVGATDTIYTGSSTAAVYVTTDASTWNLRTNGLPAGGEISDIVIDPTDPATAYVAFHRTSGPRVLRTENYGVNWTDQTGDLPTGISARALAVDWRFDPPGLYAGSGVGIYSSEDGGVTWVKDGLDLPNVNIGDLAINTVNHTLIAGTYGRGAWRAALPPVPCPTPGDVNGDGLVNGADIACFIECRVIGAASPPCVCECAYPGVSLTDATTAFIAALLVE